MTSSVAMVAHSDGYVPHQRASRPSALFHNLGPGGPDYATLPIEQAFNWSEVLAAVDDGRWFLVVFRSVLLEGADRGRLKEYDDRAHADAATSPGFVFYFKGGLNERLECLSFCLWDNRDKAREAAVRPLHVSATKIAGDTYSSYVLERYDVSVSCSAEGRRIEFARL